MPETKVYCSCMLGLYNNASQTKTVYLVDLDTQQSAVAAEVNALSSIYKIRMF